MAEKKIQKKRCQQCNKRLKLLDENVCKCGNMFCPKHRLCHSHDCGYNKKVDNKKRIAKNNPKVKCDKVEKI